MILIGAALSVVSIARSVYSGASFDKNFFDMSHVSSAFFFFSFAEKLLSENKKYLKHTHTAEELRLINTSALESDVANGDYYNYFFFHLSFALGSQYFAMLLTNWNVQELNDGVLAVDYGVISMWVKMVSQWITILLYFWSLLAPCFCKNRHFE